MANAKTLIAASAGAAITALNIISIAPAANAFGVITSDGYRAEPIRARFIDISTPNQNATRVLANTSSNNASATVNTTLPFNFNLFGTSYNAVNINTNGTINFGGSNNSGTNLDLTSAIPVLPTIAALWDNWSFVGGDAVYYKLTGNPGKQNLIVQWNQAIQGNKTATFQALIRESGNAIEFRYQDQDINNANSATIGVSSGQLAAKRLQWSYNTPFSSYQLAPPIGIRPLNR